MKIPTKPDLHEVLFYHLITKQCVHITDFTYVWEYPWSKVKTSFNAISLWNSLIIKDTVLTQSIEAASQSQALHIDYIVLSDFRHATLIKKEPYEASDYQSGKGVGAGWCTIAWQPASELENTNSLDKKGVLYCT